MKNLKKVLALVLAFACAFTMFAGAAFKDQADIKTTEAVDTLVALGVIKGYDDGSFRPDATVTRAEMAKMIYVLRTGKDDASAYASAATKFDDLNGASTAWAAGYVKYCEALGIIAGKSATKFDPAATVTGEEAAKMLLVTLGYDAEKAGLIGTSWAKTTIALADQNGLLEDVNAPLSLALPRQYAAQMIFNAIDAHTVKLTDGEYSNMNIIGTYYPTIGEKYMGLKKTVGTLTGVVMDKDTYKLTIDSASVNTTESTVKSTSGNVNTYYTSFSKVAKDYSALKDQTVKVLFKAEDNVYGVYATKDTSTMTGVVNNFSIDGGKLKFDGSKYSFVSPEPKAVVDTKSSNTTDASAYINAATGAALANDMKVLLNDDNKVKSVNVTSYMVGKVSYVGKDYVNVAYKAASDVTSAFDGYSKLDADSCNSSIADLKKDDYVILTNSAVNDKLDAVKATMVSGNIASTKDSGNEVKIDNVWYKSALAANADLALGNTVTAVVKNSHIVYVDDVKATSTDVALMVEAATNSGVGAKWQADLLFADGKREVVEINTDTTTGNVHKSSIFKNQETLELVSNGPVLVSYSKSGTKYELDLISKGTNQAGYNDVITAAAKSYVKDGKIVPEGGASTTSYINTGATVFLKYGSDDYKVVAGDAMKKWGESTKFNATLLTDNSNGYPYAKVAFVNTDKNPTGSDKTYAYIFSVEATKVDGEDVMVYNVFNGTEATTLKFKQSAANAYDEGTVVEYSLDSDGYASEVNKYDLTAGAMSGYAWDGKGKDGDIKIVTTGTSETAYKVDKDDTMVLFIDTDGKVGVADASLQEAIKAYNDSGAVTGYTKNVAFIANKTNTDTLDVIVIDTTNEIKTALFN